MLGLKLMLYSVFMFSSMYTFVYMVKVNEPQASPLASSFVRLMVNLILLVVLSIPKRETKKLFGDGRKSLWLRGIFGSISVTLSFAAFQYVPIGEASFLHSTNGVFVALLGPFFLKQKNHLLVWFAIIGALLGAGLMFKPSLSDAAILGKVMALSSGFLAALAYLMIARAGTSNSAQTVVFYFCMIGVGFHIILFMFLPVSWPQKFQSYAMLIAAGLCASLAQNLMTKAYQSSQAALVASISYVGPVLNLISGMMFFSEVPDPISLVGAATIILCGGCLPFLIQKRLLKNLPLKALP